MIYRPIGSTGMSASIIGLGAEFLDNKPYGTVEQVVNTALEHGVNIMDIFMPGETIRKNIGQVLAGRRDKMLIQGHICSTDVNKQYDKSRDRKTIEKYFESLLRCLNTDYIDFGMLFFVDSEKEYIEVFEGDALAYAIELKKKGYIRAIGASTHNPLTARKMAETGHIELIMFSLNPAFDMAPAGVDVHDYVGSAPKKPELDYEKKLDPGRAALYRFCEQRGVAITVMKTLAGGKLLSPQHTPFVRPLTVNQCIHYALTRPAVVSVLTGCATREQMLESLGYLDAGEEERDYSAVISEYQGSMKGNCVYCSHCQPCPMEIDIAAVNKYLDIAAQDEKNIRPLGPDAGRNDSTAAANYRALKHRAPECSACGSCEERCPFSVPVIQNMKKAAAIFGI